MKLKINSIIGLMLFTLHTTDVFTAQTYSSTDLFKIKQQLETKCLEEAAQAAYYLNEMNTHFNMELAYFKRTSDSSAYVTNLENIVLANHWENNAQFQEAALKALMDYIKLNTHWEGDALKINTGSDFKDLVRKNESQKNNQEFILRMLIETMIIFNDPSCDISTSGGAWLTNAAGEMEISEFLKKHLGFHQETIDKLKSFKPQQLLTNSIVPKAIIETFIQYYQGK